MPDSILLKVQNTTGGWSTVQFLSFYFTDKEKDLLAQRRGMKNEEDCSIGNFIGFGFDFGGILSSNQKTIARS